MINHTVAKQIKNAVQLDQAMRKCARKTGRWNPSVDRKNVAVIKKIIKIHGWPTISLVGKKQSKNAWLIVQHAEHDVKFQESVLKLLIRQYSENPKSIDPSGIAFLTDRILVLKNKKQKFGTQFFTDKNGAFKLWPIKSLKGIDEVRKKYHLLKFSKYEKMINDRNKS